MTLLRPDVEALEQNGITRVALPNIDDPSIIPLWFGEGDLPTAEFIREAAKEALDEGLTFYSHTRGRMEARLAIKAYLDRIYGIDLDPGRVTVPGSTMLGITIAAQMALTTGTHGLIVTPNWPNIESTFRVTGAEIGFVRQRQEHGRWSLPVEDIAAALRDDTRAIFLNSPCNPTGWVMPEEEQIRLLEICREREILLIADEVYHRNVFDRDVAPSFMTLASDEDPVIVVNGFSKAWAMTGWRLGWMVAPIRYQEQLAVLSECFNTSAPSFVQRAGIAALEGGEEVVSDLRARYARGRELVMEILGANPHVDLVRPDGAFYAFPRIPGLGSSLAFAEGLIEEEKVGVAPGYTFGPGNEEHFRLCFAQSRERLETALRRISDYVVRHGNEYG